MGFLSASNLCYTYPDSNNPVVKHLSLEVSHGEIVQLSGGNGAGKTTALRLLSGELVPTSGVIDTDLTSRILYLDQNASSILAPDLTVRDHVSAITHGYSDTTLQELMSKFNVQWEEMLDKFCGQLSGGEKQKVALICALWGNYEIILLDEFTAHLDLESERFAYELVNKKVISSEVGAVLVSHRKVPFTVNKIIEMD